ncbi:RNA ligase [Arthrobacter phage Molivia]|uniref:RNA ligase n=1 Tax=Arthrobacter phage Molivia TaxID=2015839 RepID=A0A286S1T2_9CAUD|nr:RNA ligase and tail fiber protein attachment catalyst [Arthrobacter phage Molivia]ASX99289.1 RNA ligase [Arthrobacter phage Molivia]
MTDLYDIVDEYEIEVMEELGRIKVTKHPDCDLFIYNYTNKAQFANEWTNAERVCRGLITDLFGRVVARGMPKFFNEGDPRVGEIDLDEPLWLIEKFDGSLGVCYLDNNGMPKIATRGSFTSEQAERANAMLYTYVYDDLRETITRFARQNKTMLVEIIYPENKIVVDYMDDEQLIWLGHVDNASGRFYPNYAHAVGQVTLNEGIPAIPSNKEGYVAIADDGKMFKIKSEEYKTLHKTIFGLSNKSIWEIVAQRDGYANFTRFLRDLPAPTQVWATRKYKQLQAHQSRLIRETFDIHNKLTEDFPDRGELARRLQREAPEHLSFVFGWLDKGGEELVRLVNKAIKPKKFEPYRTEPKED